MADVLAHHAEIISAKLAAGQDVQRAISSMEDVVRRHHGNVAEPSEMGIPPVSERPPRNFRSAVRASTRAKGQQAGKILAQGQKPSSSSKPAGRSSRPRVCCFSSPSRRSLSPIRTRRGSVVLRRSRRRHRRRRRRRRPTERSCLGACRRAAPCRHTCRHP